MSRHILRAGTLGAVAALAAVAHAATFPADSDWIPLTQQGIGMGDWLDDGSGNGREIVGSASDPAVYVYVGGTEFFVRLRIDTDPEQAPGNLRPYGWGLLIDTDGDLLDYEFSLLANGITDTIELAENTTKTGVGDPSDQAETLIASYPWDSGVDGNGRVLAAPTTFNSTPDYFLDFAVPLADLTGAGISLSQPIVFWAGTSSNGRSITVDLTGTDANPGPGTLEPAASDPITLDDLPTDTDGDGILDSTEIALGTDPNDADSDDDGVIDGDEPSWADDSDGDGLINALDPDSDNDGLLDGTELGLDCSNTATDVSTGNCVPDADAGTTTTDPLAWDTDGGGASDGSEDWNLDGAIDPGETDPTAGHGADDGAVVDTDGDGLGDDLESFLGLEPNDADTDDDGLLDGLEPNPSLDSDHDGLRNGNDVDSDNDGLFDGTESGADCGNDDTDVALGHCIPDGDAGATETSPLLWDTDGGGASDGSEDWDRDGVFDVGETDPTAGNGADDGSILDSDGDGLGDELELLLGSDPDDGDSDDDGLLDGLEPNPSDDHDGDGQPNIIDEDSDEDGLFDGTETGHDCSDLDTDTTQGHCIADADAGATTTHSLDPDTDRGGLLDGVEDVDHDGAVDPSERDPNDPTDDVWCNTDGDCGGPQSGIVCDYTSTHMCIEGCRGVGGNRCPTDEICTSTDTSIGQCVSGAGGTGGTGGSATGGGGSGGGDGCEPDAACDVAGETCNGGEVCCCGWCYAAYECTCDGSSWSCHATDACLEPCGGSGGGGVVPAPSGTIWAEGNGFCALSPGREGSTELGWLLATALGAAAVRRRRSRAPRAR